ncbi:MAG: phage integrase site specific [Desulfovibrionaceae bacterium]|nr:MAG: phage integrase site specific [Desulfovibrionaceae bacterium]
MADRKYQKTRYKGVFYRESNTRSSSYGPDRCYVVWYQDASGRGRWHTVGWHSEGTRPAYANQVRQQLLDELKAGKDPAVLRTFTVGEAVEIYLKWAEAEGKHVIQDRNRYDLHLRHALDAVPIGSVTVQILTETKARLGERLSPQSIRHCFGFLRRAVNHAEAVGRWQGSNPFAVRRNGPFRLPQAENAAVRFLTPDEATKLLAELKQRSGQLHDMTLLSLKTGMRATEIFTVQGQGLDQAAGLIHFRAKGGKTQHVQASPAVLALLRAYDREPGEHVFQAQDGGPIRYGISQTFDRAVRALGLNNGITDSRRKVIFHTLRHTFASWLAQSGKVTLHELMKLMRHERIEMTLRYAHLIPDRQRDKLAIIDEVLGGLDGHG